jgi:hypothetical protein
MKGCGPIAIVGCDQRRVADDKIVEHWDARQRWADQSVSGHTMTDGPAIVAEPHQTSASKKVVRSAPEVEPGHAGQVGPTRGPMAQIAG